MKKLAAPLLLLGIIITHQLNAQPRLGKDPVKEVVAAMTPQEKINLVVGTGMNFPGLPKDMQGPVVGQTFDKVAGAAGTTYAIPRLGIPSIVVADGPAGLRIQPFRNKDSSRSYYCTAFPIGSLLASSWDTVLVKQVGAAMGNEVKEYGVDILLGPALNNQRNPLGGRNFEYYSEDPVVSGRIAAAMVNGIQSQGVGTSIKHFAANNHEFNRNTMNVVVSEKALREIYLRGFQITLQHSNPWTVMSSYNKINGTYTSESYDLLTHVLRDEWKYKGFVMTDWFGGRDAVAQIEAGNDLLMPGTGKQQQALLAAYNDGTLDHASLDNSVERILNIILLSPSFKGYKFTNKPDLKAHARTARTAAAEGMVLLQNKSQALPFARTVKKIAVFGNASYDMITGGTGSGDVNEAYTVPLTDGLKNAGYAFEAATRNSYVDYIASEKAKRPAQRNPFLLPTPIPEMEASSEMINKLAMASDIALITIGRNSGEFADRKMEGDFLLSETEKKLIKDVSTAFHARNKKVVVVLNTGGIVETVSWRDEPDAILLAWQPGQEAGNAIADVLSGKVNPSGKLTATFPLDYNDLPSSAGFPGVVTIPADTSDHSVMASARGAEVVYNEDVFNGYRAYSSGKTGGAKTAYPFGFGSSYTRFRYSAAQPSSAVLTGNQITVSVDVTNSGTRAGKEVVQLYLMQPSGRSENPAQELKAFGKTILLAPGQKQTLRFTVNAADLASFDPLTDTWVLKPGTYQLAIGASAEDIRSKVNLIVKEEKVKTKVNKALPPKKEIL